MTQISVWIVKRAVTQDGTPYLILWKTIPGRFLRKFLHSTKKNNQEQLSGYK